MTNFEQLGAAQEPFLPGMTALPAVSILSTSGTWACARMQQPEIWRSGDLIRTQSANTTVTAKDTYFLMPVGETTIPIVAIKPPERVAALSRRVACSPKVSEVCRIQFAFLPWDSAEQSDAPTGEEVRALADVMGEYARDLSVVLETGDGGERPTIPRWGVVPYVPEPLLYGVQFALNHAATLLSPFVLQVEIDHTRSTPGAPTQGGADGFTLRFDYPEKTLNSLYQAAGLGRPGTPGIAIYANAIPVMSADLRNWTRDQTFADFARTSGMKPMGLAGLSAGPGTAEERPLTIDPDASLFSVELSAQSGSASGLRYTLPTNRGQDQLLVWMTSGPALNDAMLRYVETNVIQPMHKNSAILKQVGAGTIMPCFGGLDFAASRESDWYEKLLFAFSTPDQALLKRNDLAKIVARLLDRIGYRRIEVKTITTELCVLDGERQRVTVVHLENTGGKQVQSIHLDMIQTYLNDAGPLGARVVVKLD